MKNEKKIMELLAQLDWLFGTAVMDRELLNIKEDEDHKMAEVTYEENYQRIIIRLYPCFHAKSLQEQRKAILHEFCHCITLPSKHAMLNLLDGKLITNDQIEFINEKETSRIENLLDRLLKGELQFASKAYNQFLDVKKVQKVRSRKSKNTKWNSNKQVL